MIFYKTSSFGNDFIEIDCRELTSRQGRRSRGELASAKLRRSRGELAEAICDRQRGVGADGVVFYCPARQAGVPMGERIEKGSFFFEIFNRDGGAAELSGNGMAGLAAVLFQRRLAASPLQLHAAIGPRRIELLARRGPLFQFNVEIGRPDFFNRKSFPFLKRGQERFTCEGLEFYPVSVGNPHAVVLYRERFDAARLASLGKKMESHPMFPARVNVEFVCFASADDCRVFFYERGVGPTLASSTGSAAVFAVLRRLGKVRDRLAIDLKAASTAEDPAGKEVDSHGAKYSAGGGQEKIQVSWKDGIFIHNFTRLVCRGDYFG
jgi:diaminopimelate epimerase